MAQVKKKLRKSQAKFREKLIQLRIIQNLIKHVIIKIKIKMKNVIKIKDVHKERARKPDTNSTLTSLLGST